VRIINAVRETGLGFGAPGCDAVYQMALFHFGTSAFVAWINTFQADKQKQKHS
jgi:hypothetical protein